MGSFLPDGGPLADLFGGPDDEMDEMIPVDMFFHNYVEELSRGKRSLEPDDGAAGVAPKAAKLGAAQSVGGLVLQPGVAGGMQPQFVPTAAPPLPAAGMLLPNGAPLLNGGAPAPSLPMVQPGGGLGMLPGGFAGAAPMPAAAVAAPPFGLGGLSGAPLGMPGLDMPLDPTGVGGFGTASVSLSAGLGRGGDEALSGEGGGGKGRNKTAKQQEANKIAQQRYRERKKAKFHEMEDQIATLSKQLQALQALQSRNQILEGMNDELQSQLLRQEKEVERLKHALDAAAERSLSQPHSPASSGQEGDTAAAAAAWQPECGQGGPCAPCEPTPQDLAGIDFKKSIDEQIAKIRAFLQQHGLTEGAGAAKLLGPELAAELSQLVGRGCQLCQAALRTDGVKVVELISRDPASFSKIGSADDSARWQHCLDAMALTGEQQEQLLLNRRAHLQRMRGIYQERHNLNMQAMSLMLPHSSRNPAEDNTVEGRLASMSSAGYLPVAKSSAELGDVLDRIKDNLRREQRAVMDLNCQTVTRILTPLQAAFYMLRAYPVHCDALALSNTLAKRLGREDVSGDGGAAAAAAPAAAPEISTGGCRQQG
ncbi:hypothetical protein C2E21_2067 [Chlorella sorokiniana]|uniref:BZIP domain-containing protein n=1 Tax=Chlorella sorokiniana TaxID=3076 RepID=A0A2P6TXG4_CHLSO|nr:hypothetical protein C2E21_2067 [Chlorella sorokiniana]|eukprot:PRW58753.1 hypothetical protein C2E21_2067 [Chlorella sorokiniana]